VRILIAAALLAPTVWDFEKDEPDRPPAGFEFTATKESPPGKWLVRKDGEKKVLAQLDENETSQRFAMAVAKDAAFKDVSLSVRGKPVSGKVDQAVGLVWRYKDENNYYVARSNVLEENVRLYRVVNGNRIKFAGKENVELKTGEWHTLKVEHQGALIKVFLNGEKLFEAEDRTFPDAGKVGLWIKADSVTWFDDLSAEELK
jgi:hypothetical protein